MRAVPGFQVACAWPACVHGRGCLWRSRPMDCQHRVSCLRSGDHVDEWHAGLVTLWAHCVGGVSWTFRARMASAGCCWSVFGQSASSRCCQGVSCTTTASAGCACSGVTVTGLGDNLWGSVSNWLWWTGFVDYLIVSFRCHGHSSCAPIPWLQARGL